MAMLVDWHSHHTPPELLEKIVELGARAPQVDIQDSPDFSTRISEMDAAGVDMQLVSQGNGISADRFPADQAMEVVKTVNSLIGERIAAYPDRLVGSVSITFKDVEGSVIEIQRMKDRGFRAVLLYAQGEMIGRAETEPVFAKIAELGLPIFLHGGGYAPARAPSMEHLEDAGQGVAASAHGDAAVSDCVVRMIAAGLFDRYPGLQVVIRSGGGGIPLLLSKLYWKHKGSRGEQRYADILLDHFLVDTASVNARTLRFLIDQMGEDRVVFGSDYCGGSLGSLSNALPVIEEQPDPALVKALTGRNSQRLLRI